MIEEKDNWRVVGRGLAGWHALKPDVRSSGGELEDYTYWTGKRCTGYRNEAKHGAYVYDASGADEAAFSKLVICGPMIGFGRSCRKDYRDAGSFDFVSARNYFKLLREIPGVKVGRIMHSVIVWE